MRNTRSKTKTAQSRSSPSSATRTVAARSGIPLSPWIELLMCSARKAKEVVRKVPGPRKPATPNVDAQGNLPATPSPESATALTYQAELEKLHWIIASQKKQLDDARLCGQQPSTPTTREGFHSELRTGLALSVLLIVAFFAIPALIATSATR